MLFPDVCFKQRLPFVTKFEDFRRTQSPPLAENKTDHVLKERIQNTRSQKIDHCYRSLEIVLFPTW
jgi:hypothetical protein